MINLSDGGFLADPEDEYFKYLHSDVVPFDKISDKPCLVLLGEPGIGKSTAMVSEYEAITKGAGKAVLFNLNEYGNETRLIDEIFESDEFTTWRKGDYTLNLFLDSLDECRMQIPQVAVILQKQLEKVKDPLHRLHLRIACRTADWPHVLDSSLSLLWKKEEYGVFELAPLRRKDVRVAAEANGIDPDAFVEGLVSSELVPLAIKPITLKFLIDTYKNEKRFPSSKIELYGLGCKKLCEENNPYRQDLINVGQVDSIASDQKLSIAKRIAAVSIFCKKPVIYTGTTTPLSDDEISSSALVMQGESISESQIKEVIGTGLFSGRGFQKFGFAHQTYAEYLAASFVKESNLELQQLEAIVFSSIGSERKVVPQLYETTAWLACMNKDLFGSIAANDPQVLLRGDAGSYSDEEKESLVGSILELLSENRINTRDWSLYHTYHKLKHPGLSDQLKPFITDRTKHWNVRYEVILIARKCQLTDLGDVLADVALDNADNCTVRLIAAGAVADIGSPECRKQLMPFALGQGGADPEDQLKGNALHALWPDLIDADSLFDNLTIPKRSNFSGSYDVFLSFELAKDLKPKDIPCALKWLEGTIGNGRMPFCFERVADDIMILAWKNLEQTEIAHAASDTCIDFFRHHHGILHDSDKLKENEALFKEPDKRRLIADIIVNGCIDFEKIVHGLVFYNPKLIISDDIPWLLEKVKKARSKELARKWARLVGFVCNYDNPELCEQILGFAVSSEILREELGLNPVELKSEEASKLKKYFADAEQWQKELKQQKSPKKLKPPPSERIQHCLQKIENGKIDFWIALCDELSLEDTSERYEPDKCCQLDVTKLPGWVNSDKETKERIIDVAEKFLKENPADPLKWIRKPSSWTYKDIAPNKAFCVLKQVDINRCRDLPVETWSKWTPALIGISLFGDSDKREGHELVKIAYEKCPDTFISALQQQIDAENAKGNTISVHEKLKLCWDERLCDAVLEKVRQPYIKRGEFNSFRNLLACLVERNHQSAIEYAKSLIKREWTQDTEEGKKMLDAAIVLMENTDDACWDVIWPAITGNPEFGRELLQEYASFNHIRQLGKLAEHVDVDKLGKLHIWLEHEFPRSEDPQHDGAHAVGNREAIAQFRDDLLRVLENTGTVEACQTIEKIVEALPELGWLKSVLVEAKKNTIRKIWHPPTPEQFLALTNGQAKMLVRNGDELQAVVIGSLRRLEAELQGETAAAQFLWDTRVSKPKEESAFSDYVKNFLQKDLQQFGIAALREVETRRGLGNRKGEETDIYVTVCVPNSLSGQNERITIIVEAKGCWNGGLFSDMKNQLADRYLKDIQCNHGIYFVGWFACPQCKYDNCKTRICRKCSIDDLRSQLDAQARALSTNDLRIKSLVINAALR